MYSRPPSILDLELGRGLCCHPFCLPSIWTTFRSFDHCYLDFVVLYADNILLIASSISELQELFDACVIELSWLDMNINEKSLAVSALVHDGM